MWPLKFIPSYKMAHEEMRLTIMLYGYLVQLNFKPSTIVIARQFCVCINNDIRGLNLSSECKILCLRNTMNKGRFDHLR